MLVFWRLLVSVIVMMLVVILFLVRCVLVNGSFEAWQTVRHEMRWSMFLVTIVDVVVKLVL